jgi:hypothetical protein
MKQFEADASAGQALPAPPRGTGWAVRKYLNVFGPFIHLQSSSKGPVFLAFSTCERVEGACNSGRIGRAT